MTGQQFITQKLNGVDLNKRVAKTQRADRNANISLTMMLREKEAEKTDTVERSPAVKTITRAPKRLVKEATIGDAPKEKTKKRLTIMEVVLLFESHRSIISRNRRPIERRTPEPTMNVMKAPRRVIHDLIGSIYLIDVQVTLRLCKI